LASGNLFSGDQAVAAHQIVHRHERKCRHDPNMDGLDYDSYPESLEGDGQTPLVPVEPGGIYPLKSVCKDRSATLAGSALPARPPAAQGRNPGGSFLKLEKSMTCEP